MKGTVKVNATTTIAGNKLTIKPNATLSYSTKYNLTIPRDAVKNGTTILTAPFTSTFTTGAALKTTILNATAPTTAYATKNFTVKGQLTANGTGIIGKTITLQRSTNGITWSTLKTNVTIAGGSYQFARNESAAGVYYYRTTFAGDTAYTNATSNVVTVTISKLPTALTIIAPSVADVNKSFTVSGKLTANGVPLGGQNVTLFRYNPATNAWTTLGKVPTNSTGVVGLYTFNVKEGAANSYAYQVMYAGTTAYRPTNSNTQWVDVA
jgi:Bacterial Ig-like domain